uniref:Uncharacterized protein n=1 Tax=Arundo donax TaxID=35708 RepID=A0A0A9HA55_ARUDO
MRMARSNTSTPSSRAPRPPPRGSSSGTWRRERGGWRRPAPRRSWTARASCG